MHPLASCAVRLVPRRSPLARAAWLAAALACLAAWASTPLGADAQSGGWPTRAAAGGPKRVVVETFGGPQASRVRSSLVADLAEHGDAVTLVDERELRDAARQAGLRAVRTDADYAAMARALNVSAFVDGRVGRRGRAWTATVRVRSGETGAVIGTETWSGATIAALGAVRRNGYARLRPHLEAARSPQAGPPQPAPADPVERPWYQADEARAVDDERPASEDDGGPEGDDRHPAFRLALGGGTLYRSMATRVVPVYSNMGIPAEGPAEDRSYTSAAPGHPELGVELEFYPGAFGSQPLPWLGLVASYRRAVGLGSTGCAPAVPGNPCPSDVDVPTSQQELFVGLRAKYVFGSPRTGPEIFADVGYGLFEFILDPSALVRLDPSSIVPPVSYSYLHVAAGVSYPVVPTYLVLGARFGIRPGLGLGADQKRVWGTGTSGAFGWQLGLDVRSEAPYIVRGLYFALAVQYFSFSTAYSGQTACVSEPCTPWTSDWRTRGPGTAWQPLRLPEPVGDGYLRVALSLGYAFR
jgi:hypothetical protein